MRRWPAVAAALLATLALFPTAASARAAKAGDVQLAWHAMRDAGGEANRSFACDTVGGSHFIVVSFTAPESLSKFVAMDVIIDISTTAAELPPWWEFKNSGSCRTLSLSMDVRPSSLPDSGKGVMDPWDGGQTGIGVITGYGTRFNGDPRLAEMVLALARPISKPTALTAGKVYFACTLRIDNRRTKGEYACAGCNVPVTIHAKAVKLYEPGGKTFVLDIGEDGCIGWQGAACATAGEHPNPPGTKKTKK